MSVNITVNGKFTKQTILDDPERTKRELENHRRTLRLQQVRAQSKELARKIRNDVSQEKEKQLRNLDAIKAQELNCWREHVLAQKCHDYQKSLNELGQAHKAAKAENDARKLQKKESTPSISSFSQRSRVFGKKSNTGIRISSIQENEKHLPESTHGKRAQVCFDENIQHCSCIDISDSEDDEKFDIDCGCSSLSSTSSLEILETTETRCTQTDAPATKSKKTKINVAVDTDSLVVVTTDKPVKTKTLDKDTQLSPKKATATKIDKVTQLSPKKTTTCTQTSMDSHTDTCKSVDLSTSSLEIVETKNAPRYTQISDLIAKQQQKEVNPETRPCSPKQNDIEVVEKTTTTQTTMTTTKTSSPTKSLKSIPSRVLIAPKSSAVTIITPGTTERMASGSDSSSKVQYYDYRNKYSRQYALPTARAVPQTNEDEPNAMEQANLEKSLQKKRDEELEKLRQKSDERGQRALEREQVRRECIELTEKLEALAQNPQSLLPTDANLHNHQYYSIKTARKESKLNGAIEELLSRPAIITCPDVRGERLRTMQNFDNDCRFPMQSIGGDLNLGATGLNRDSEQCAKNENLSSDSSSSILLGYIDDQRNNIRKEITQCEANPASSQEKVDKLQKLLDRIENLRGSLMKEIENSEVEKKSSEEAVAEKTEDDRKKSNGKVKKKTVADEQENRDSSKGRKKLSSRPSLAEIKILAGEDQIIERPEPGKPLEIVIKVQSEKTTKKSPKLNVRKSSVSKEIPVDFKKKKLPSIAPAGLVNKPAAPAASRRSSYDSNSTAYRSLPAAFKGVADQIVKRLSKQPPTAEASPNHTKDDEFSTAPASSNASTTQGQAVNVPKQRQRRRPVNQLIAPTKAAVEEPPQRQSRSHPNHKVQEAAESAPKQPPSHLNPLIAQYIQRLLAMSRDSVNALEVSSSDVETPGSSIVNITANMPSADQGDSLAFSEDHLQRVEKFINDNRNFINEMEESFRTHSNHTIETSLRHLEEAWKEKFKNMSKRQTIEKAPPERSSAPKPSKKRTNDKLEKEVMEKLTTVAKLTKQPDSHLYGNKKQKPEQVPDLESGPQSNPDKELSQTQLKHYAELTKNCSNRIAELTALITKVREEKQRLLEITLTSASDNERNSTEYRELPAPPKNDENNEPLFSDAGTPSGSSIGSPAEVSPDQRQIFEKHADNTSAVLPLEKHKKTGQSRDSGISMPSRPVTAMGNDNEPEPQSFGSSVQTNTTTQTTSSVLRKTRPPPAMTTQHRYSPQATQDEVVHELSTIVEVDTPATSRLNTSLPTQSNQPSVQQPSKKADAVKEPTRFPTFEEYVRANNLDLTTLDHEQSLLMELEYNELIEALEKGHGHQVVNYDAFPTLSAYLQNLTTSDQKCISPDTFEDLFECLRGTTVAAKPFPSHQEYLEQRKSNSSEVNLLDSDSLENATSGGGSAYTETESETIDIEGELQRRNILKGSFRSLSAKGEMVAVLSSDKKRPNAKIAHSTAIQIAHSTAIQIDSNFTGAEKTNSTISDSASEKFQQELKALGLQWPQTMRKKEKQAAALSSSSSSEPATSKLNDQLKKIQKSPKKSKKSICEIPSDSESSDRPLNLRDFLTRQLLKHAAATSSADSSLSGDSLRSQFFLAVLESMTPSGSPRANCNTAASNRNERQKTSTPVPSPLNGASTSNSTQLFSNESHISAVQPQPHANTNARSSARKDKSNAKDKSKRKKNN